MNFINKKQVFIGILSLIAGFSIYVIGRNPEDSYLMLKIGREYSLYNKIPNIFGPAGNFLPAFLHVFSFSLITAGVLNLEKKGYLIVCTLWTIIDMAFEFGQKFKHVALSLIPDFFHRIPVLDASTNYFRSGTFDYCDIAAIIVGGIVAFLILLKTHEKEKEICIQKK